MIVGIEWTSWVYRELRWPSLLRIKMIVGQVVRNQVPMLVTFEEDEVDYICEVLGQSIVMAYNVIDMFTDREEWGGDEYE